MKNIYYFFCLMFLLGWNNLLAQQDCSTKVTPEQIRFEAEFDRNVMSKATAHVRTSSPYHVPIKFHIVRKSDGTGGVSLFDVDSSLYYTNQHYEDIDMHFFQYGNIDYIDNDTYYNNPDSATRQAIRLTNDVNYVINVYFTDLTNICGEGNFPSMSVQGVIIANDCIGSYTNTSTMAHEIGHYFNLYHTHEDAFAVECPNESNCSTAGDKVCDTPADPGLSGHVSTSCVYDNYASPPSGCGSTAYSPDPSNIMSYAKKECRTNFTAGQYSRIFSTFIYTRPYLSNRLVYVDGTNTYPGTGTFDDPYVSVSLGLAYANTGDCIIIKSGSYPTIFTASQKNWLYQWDVSSSSVIIGK